MKNLLTPFFFKLTIITLLTLTNTFEIYSQKSNTKSKPINDDTQVYLPDFDERAVVKIFSYSGIVIDMYEKGSKLYGFLDVGHGSGTMITSDGIILTAKHVVENARFIAVKIQGNSLTFPAEIVYMSDVEDYAFIAIKGNNFIHKSMPSAPPKIKIGQQIWAYGYPIVSGEPEPNITKGIITRYSKVRNKWQFDATIAGGNSGGPMVTNNGDICGIVVEGYGFSSGLNFSVIMDTVIITYNNLMKSGDLKGTKKKLEETNIDYYKAKQAVSVFFTKYSMNERYSVAKEEIASLKFDLINILDSAKIKKEWAFLKEVTSLYYYNLAMNLIYNKNTSIFNAKNLDFDSYNEYIYFLKNALAELKIAQNMDKSSIDALDDLRFVLNLALDLAAPQIETDYSSGSSWSSAEISTILGYYESRWTSSQIQSLINDISISGFDFKRKWGKNPKDDLRNGIKCIIYSNLFVALKDDYVNALSFQINDLPNEKIPAFKNINPYSTKIDIIGILGDKYSYKTENTDNIKEIYTWKLDNNLSLIITFNYMGKVYSITVIRN